VPQPSSRDEVVRNAQRGNSLTDFFLRERRPLGAELLTDEGREQQAREQAEREGIVETLLELIEGLYVHLPQKRATYGKDPVQRLRLLQQRVRQRSASLTRWAFDAELATIFTELRDAHTRYVGPARWRGKVAVLPFMLEIFGSEEEPRFLVSNVVEDDPVFEGTRFGKGVEVLWWNGAPIARAVERYADRETGGRPDARLARARDSLTFRPLGYGLPPDEHWVYIRYKTSDGEELEVRVDWRVVDTSRKDEEETAPVLDAHRAFAVDPVSESVRRAKLVLFAPEIWYRREQGLATAVSAAKPPEAGEWVTGRFQQNVAAKRVETSSGEVGYLRLWSFDLIDDDGFLEEVQELLKLLPSRGLIVDLRANPGGYILAAERLLQLFTPHEIVPTRFELLATDLTREMAEARQNSVLLEPWRRSLKEAVENGEPYSRAAPLTPPPLCNNVGQRYGGPVVCVVDANTYSAGDLFAAGFVDNRVGPLISIGKATGAGGANVWMPSHVRRALAGTRYRIDAFPEGVGFTLAVRRAVRSGASAGTLIEDVGVPGQIRYELTRRDLTEGNVDLLELCGKLLASEPSTDLSVERVGTAQLEVVSSGLDRVDVYVDGHPAGPSLRAGSDPLQVTLPSPWAEAAVLGFQGQILRQRRLIHR